MDFPQQWGKNFCHFGHSSRFRICCGDKDGNTEWKAKAFVSNFAYYYTRLSIPKAGHSIFKLVMHIFDMYTDYYYLIETPFVYP